MTAAGKGGAAGSADTVRRLVRFLPLILLLVAMAVVFATGAHRYVSFDKLVANRDRLQAFVATHEAKALAAYAATYVAVVALSVPGAVFLTVFGGFLFGWLIGGIVTAVAATVGGTIVFLIARTSLGDILARKAGPRLERIITGLREDAFAYLLFLRLVPIFPFWLVNLAPALVGVSLKTFVLATAIGILPGTFAFSFAGEGLDSVIAGQKAAKQACLAAGRSNCAMGVHVKALLTPKLVAALAALGLVALTPVIVRRWFRRRVRPLDAGSRPP